MKLFGSRSPLIVAIGLGLVSIGLLPVGVHAGGFCHHRGMVVMNGTQSFGLATPFVGGGQMLVQGQSLVPMMSQSVVPATMQSYALVPVMNGSVQQNGSGQQLVGAQGVSAQGIPPELVAGLIRQILPLILGGNNGGLNIGNNPPTNLGGGAVSVQFPQPLRVVIQTTTTAPATAPTSSNGFPPLNQFGGQSVPSGQAGNQGQALIQAQGAAATMQSLDSRLGNVESQLADLKTEIRNLSNSLSPPPPAK